MVEGCRVGVTGCGYVGLVTGAWLSHLGHRVVCVDKDEGRIRELEEGRVPFYEPGLEELLAKSASWLRFSTKLDGVVREADVIFIALDTTQGEDGSADLSSVAAVARSIEEGPKVLVDGRNVVEPEAPLEAGLAYRGFGRG